MMMDWQARVVNSSLWAAAGDAIGWITELGREDTVEARSGVRLVERPIKWKRKIGGRIGIFVDFEAGTYSDDTQLRLAVCRSIRGDGSFDAEAFGRVELTVWQSYALGAGLGSKAAAANLTRRGVNWFSNFFEDRAQTYKNAGGNGAAMRIQPHVWMRDGARDGLLLATMRDALITHGHPHGFLGAAFHALALEDAMRGKAASPAMWRDYLAKLTTIPEVVANDRQLHAFWLPAWESMTGHSLAEAIEVTAASILYDISQIEEELDKPEPKYARVLECLNLYEPSLRGSGIKTALAASAITWIYRDGPVADAMVECANALGSDTDTIATMAGALLGARSENEPDWPIQDREYIVQEAVRLSAIASGKVEDSFAYPDLTRWAPPSNQSDAVLQSGDSLALAGLGEVEPVGKEYRSGDAIWQWMKLPFGQTVLAKRRVNPGVLDGNQLPGERRTPTQRAVTAKKASASLEPSLPFATESSGIRRSRPPERLDPAPNLDQITDYVIQSDFDNYTIGRAFNDLLERQRPIEEILGFAAIISKAKIARLRRRR